jgi:low molecular weight protein-tyrosine phosphatase
MVRVNFVCMGNICRSPTAEGVMRHLVEEAGLRHAIEVDSSGTSGYHVGDAPDPRSRAEAARRGISLAGMRSRRFASADFSTFQYNIAVDDYNLRILEGQASDDEARASLSLLRDHDPAERRGQDVPDPYYGGANGFPKVYDIVEGACRGLLDTLRREHGL